MSQGTTEAAVANFPLIAVLNLSLVSFAVMAGYVSCVTTYQNNILS